MFFFVPPPVRTIGEFARHRDLPSKQREKRLGGNTYKLADSIAVLTPKMAWNAIFTGKPYPIKAMLLHGTNPVITRANANEVYRALSQVDFLVVSDFFLTPTVELADIVLPAATWLEFNDIAGRLFRHGYVFAQKKLSRLVNAGQTIRFSVNWVSDWGKRNTGGMTRRVTLTIFLSHQGLLGSSLKKWAISRERWNTGNMKGKASLLPRKRLNFTLPPLISGAMTLCLSTGRYQRAR
ncbi:molybdopterin-dependent oxidoreductase [Chloroflexota bacterium]